MNPLEIVAKTLYSFEEKNLTYELLDAFGKKAKIFQQYDEVAKIFFEIKNFSKAIEYGEKALKIAESPEEKYVTAKNLINAYNQNNYPEKSITQISKIKSINPQDTELLLEETFAYSALNQKDKAEKLLFDLIKKKLPPIIERKVYHNLSGHYFRKDDIHTGLKHFLSAGIVQAYKDKKLPPFPRWNGEIIPGKKIIIDSQCGAGDEIMHVRFMRHLKQLRMKPIWTSTRRELVEIFNFNGFDSVCIYDDPVFPKDSCWVYALALPYHLKISAEELGRESYLNPLPEKEEQYAYLKEDKKYKIGMFWNSGSGFEQAHFRSVDFNDYMKVLNNDKFSLYSLQMKDEPVPEEYKSIIKEFHFPGREFLDTFSIVSQMDLVITSCTSIAHVAAAMGKEVCVFVPIMEYYVWTSSTGKSWWYGDNVHMFKQKKPRNWDEPIKELGKFLDGRNI